MHVAGLTVDHITISAQREDKAMVTLHCAASSDDRGSESVDACVTVTGTQNMTTRDITKAALVEVRRIVDDLVAEYE